MYIVANWRMLAFYIIADIATSLHVKLINSYNNPSHINPQLFKIDFMINYKNSCKISQKVLNTQ